MAGADGVGVGDGRRGVGGPSRTLGPKDEGSDPERTTLGARLVPEFDHRVPGLDWTPTQKTRQNVPTLNTDRFTC